MLRLLNIRFWARDMVEQLDDYKGLLYDFEFEYAKYRNFRSVVLAWIKALLGNVVIVYVLFLMLGNMYNLNELKPVLAKWFTVPIIIIITFVMLAHALAWSEGSTFVSSRMFVIQVQVYGICFCLFGVLVGRHTKQTQMWWQFTYYVVMYAILLLSVEYAFLRYNVYQEMSDLEKIIVGTVIIPLCFEIFMATPGRYMVRTWRHHHESTSLCLVALSMATSKGVTRMMVSLVKDFNYVIVGSLLIGFQVFISVSSVRVRDQFGYWLMGRSLDNPADAFNTMRAAKNRFLRCRLAHLETQLELAFTASAIFTVFIMDISGEADPPHKPSTGADLLISFAIQYGSEVAIEFICISWLCVMDKQPILTVAHNNFRGYTWYLSWIGTLVSIYCMRMIFPRMLERPHAELQGNYTGSIAQWKFVVG